jgi:hypothetical protein
MWDKQVDTMAYRKDWMSSSLTYLLPKFEEKALRMFDILLMCEVLNTPIHHTTIMPAS